MKIILIILAIIVIAILFNRKNKPQPQIVKEEKVKVVLDLEPVGEMLDEERFWNIVEESNKNTNSADSQEEYLVSSLEKLTPKEIVGFRLRTDKLLYDTYNSEMWAAIYVMNGGCSDDCFEYFRLWVISKGKDVYYKAKENPDSLLSISDQKNDGYFDFESFWYVALTAFENTTGAELYDYMSEDFKYTEGQYPKFEFTWSEEKPETLKEVVPDLYKKFWK